MNLSIVRRPGNVRDQMIMTIEPTITSGPNQKTFPVIHPEMARTIFVGVGKSLPKPANRSDILGTT